MRFGQVWGAVGVVIMVAVVFGEKLNMARASFITLVVVGVVGATLSAVS